MQHAAKGISEDRREICAREGPQHRIPRAVDPLDLHRLERRYQTLEMRRHRLAEVGRALSGALAMPVFALHVEAEQDDPPRAGVNRGMDGLVAAPVPGPATHRILIEAGNAGRIENTGHPSDWHQRIDRRLDPAKMLDALNMGSPPISIGGMKPIGPPSRIDCIVDRDDSTAVIKARKGDVVELRGRQRSTTAEDHGRLSRPNQLDPALRHGTRRLPASWAD